MKYSSFFKNTFLRNIKCISIFIVINIFLESWVKESFVFKFVSVFCFLFSIEWLKLTTFVFEIKTLHFAYSFILTFVYKLLFQNGEYLKSLILSRWYVVSCVLICHSPFYPCSNETPLIVKIMFSMW